jgi:hypothetical protein
VIDEKIPRRTKGLFHRKCAKESPMYRLMKSENTHRNNMSSGVMSSYRQTEVDHFMDFIDALEACKFANIKSKSRFYVLDESGKEYYDSAWID